MEVHQLSAVYPVALMTGPQRSKSSLSRRARSAEDLTSESNSSFSMAATKRGLRDESGRVWETRSSLLTKEEGIAA